MADPTLNYVFEPNRYVERGKAYASAIGGRRYSVAHQTPGTTITGQTSFVATTPTFIIYQASAEHRVVLSNFALCQVGTPAGDLIHVALVLDSANRYSSVGTTITPKPVISYSTETPGFTFRYSPIATAAAGGTKILNEWTQPVWPGSVFCPDLNDGVIIGQTGSILVYTWAASTAPTWIIGGFDVLEDE